LQLVLNASCWFQQNFFGSQAMKGMAVSYLYLVGRILFALIFITAAARHMAPRTRKLATAKKCRKDFGGKSWKKDRLAWQGAEMRSAWKCPEFSSWIRVQPIS
jgi:hypothetical protein